MGGSITDIPGVRVGHAQDTEAATGCTVILFENGARGAVDLRGGGTSTRQIDPLLDHHAFGNINALLLSGGSAYGLSAADGVMRYLEERGVGLDVGGGIVVPSVPTAVIFDLRIGNGARRPDPDMAHEACVNASAEPAVEGCVGAGTGATVGKVISIRNATKSGIGTASLRLESGAWIGALVVVNAFGDVRDPSTGEIIAGHRASPDGREFPGTSELIKRGDIHRVEPFESTTLAVVATNASFDQSEILRIAKIGQTGVARTIVPCHTASDGDMVFALTTGTMDTDANAVGIIAGELVSEAIVRAIAAATSLCGIPSRAELFGR